MIRLMIGRDLKSLYIPPKAAPARRRRWRSSGLVTTAFPEKSVSLLIRRGEILGLAGPRRLRPHDAGADRLRRAARQLGGVVSLDGRELAIRSARDAIAEGIYLVPEDRKRSGLLLDMPIVENITLADLPSYARMRHGRWRRASARVAEEQRTQARHQDAVDRNRWW